MRVARTIAGTLFALMMAPPAFALIDCGNSPEWLWDIIRQSDVIALVQVQHEEYRWVDKAVPPEFDTIHEEYLAEHGDQQIRWVEGVVEVRFRAHETWKAESGTDSLALRFTRPVLTLGNCPSAEFRAGETAIFFLQELDGALRPVGGPNGVIYPDAELVETYRRLVQISEEYGDGDSPPLEWLMTAAMAPGLRSHGVRGLVEVDSQWIIADDVRKWNQDDYFPGLLTAIDLNGGHREIWLSRHPDLTAPDIEMLAIEFLDSSDPDAELIFLSGVLAGYRGRELDRAIAQSVDDRLEATLDGECEHATCLTPTWLMEAVRYFGDPRPMWRLYIHTDDELDDMEDGEWFAEIWNRARTELWVPD